MFVHFSSCLYFFVYDISSYELFCFYSKPFFDCIVDAVLFLLLFVANCENVFLITIRHVSEEIVVGVVTAVVAVYRNKSVVVEM